ncbi:MAG: LysR family transcriptional regulator [Casimicrobiaceae bacterium]|nr:LysR family transcriptional regulator [Pseudomonadota bacterium]
MADRRLQVFQAVAKHRSFTKAAEALFMTQPAVTFQVRQLEDHFGARLFDRAPGGITLTTAGAVVLDYAERILALSTELDMRVKEMGGQVTGPLLIGASTTIAEFLLPQILGEFKARFPALVPRVFVANSEAVQGRIDERSLDLGFIEGDSHWPTLVSEVCCEDELKVVCAPSHPLTREKIVTARELRQHAYITREAGSGTRQVTDHYFERAGVPPDSLNVVMELGSPEALKGLVATGLGFAIISKTAVVKEVRLGQLVQIALSPRLVRHLSVVYPKERIRPQIVTSFVAFAKTRLVALTSDQQ